MNTDKRRSKTGFLSAFTRVYLRLLMLAALLAGGLTASATSGPAADLARAVRENSFDRDECYRVRELRLAKEDVKVYLTDGHLIFGKPVGGRRIAAVFVADTEGGDAEIILMPPDRAERRSLAAYTHSPNLDEHFRTALFLFTGDDYAALVSQISENPFNRKTPEIGAMMDEEYTPTLRNLATSYQTRLVDDLLNAPARPPGLFAALINSVKLGSFDVIFDPIAREQVMAGQVTSRNGRFYFDSWTSFTDRSARHGQTAPVVDLDASEYRIDATVNPDLSLSAVTRIKVRPRMDGLRALAFDITPQMEVTGASLDGRPVEVLQRESLRGDAARGGNEMFLLAADEPLREGRAYEVEIRHSGKVIGDAGDHVLYVSARGNWYPMHGVQFATYDLTFRYPRDLDLAAPGDVVEERTEGDWRITHRRTAATIRIAAFNLGNYARQKVERGGFVVEVCANRALERALQPRQAVPTVLPHGPGSWRQRTDTMTPPSEAPPDPLERLQKIAVDVASAMEFMTSKFGPPALPHLTVSPIPGTFGQGFPGLIYLSTLAYLNKLPSAFAPANVNDTAQLFFQEMLQAHETAHQWWGNRVAGGSYRDNWMMEALANYSALLYLEKIKGPRLVEGILDHYRDALLAKGLNGETVESAGAIVLGGRLESSLEPAAWRSITYGKGTWIIQMLRRRLGDQRFFAMLAELTRRYDRQEISTEQFRQLAAAFLPPKSEDPQLETFFDEWVYGTGVPSLKLSYAVKGKVPSLRLTGTLVQSGVNEDFATLAPVEIQVARGRIMTQWVRCSNEPATFSVALKAPPLKVTLDPNHAVLRKP
jgi:Peptidase family M1 domain